MPWDINKVIMVGRLAQDVDLKYTQKGTAIAKFGIAVGERPSPDGTNNVSFFNVVLWGKQAENASRYLSKGRRIALEGRLHQRSWKAQDGSNRSVVEIIAERVEFLDSAGKQGAAGSFDSDFYDNDGFTIDNGIDPTPIEGSDIPIDDVGY